MHDLNDEAVQLALLKAQRTEDIEALRQKLIFWRLVAAMLAMILFGVVISF